MNLDIETTVRVIFLLLLAAGAGIFFSAVRAFREASRLRFFLKRREILSRAWRLVLFAILTIGAGFLINRFGEPATYEIFEPSPTITLTPTVTLTPTETITPEFTYTPVMPAVISEDFTSEVTPNPDARFSPVEFARRLNGVLQPVDPGVLFNQPITTIFGAFTYANMTVGAQWTSLWFRDGELITYESIEWNGASGGYGFADLVLPAEEWEPGIYEVQIFVGDTWKTSGSFEVAGTPPTATPTPTLTETATPTETLQPTETIVPTETETIPPTSEAEITVAEPTETATSQPISTATQTLTPTITLTPQPTRRSTFFR